MFPTNLEKSDTPYTISGNNQIKVHPDSWGNKSLEVEKIHFLKQFARLWNIAGRGCNFSQLFPEESNLWQICENPMENKRWRDLPLKGEKHEKNNRSHFFYVVYGIMMLENIKNDLFDELLWI